MVEYVHLPSDKHRSDSHCSRRIGQGSEDVEIANSKQGFLTEALSLNEYLELQREASEQLGNPLEIISFQRKQIAVKVVGSVLKTCAPTPQLQTVVKDQPKEQPLSNPKNRSLGFKSINVNNL
jgi:hypothetical protein